MHPTTTRSAVALVVVASWLPSSCAEPSDCHELATCPADAAASAAPGDASAISTASMQDAGTRARGLDSGQEDLTAPGRLIPLAPTETLVPDASPTEEASLDDELQDSELVGSADAANPSIADAGARGIDAGSTDAGQRDACADDECDAAKRNCFELGSCECQPEQTRGCEEGAYFGPCAAGAQTCNAEGFWDTCSVAPASADLCTPGADENCDGVPNSPLDPSCECVSGDVECVSDVPSTARRTCIDGLWSLPEPCDYVCTDEGVCGGVCTPGLRICNGNNAAECDVTGQWVDLGPCDTTTTCQGAGQCAPCPDGSYASNGVCVPWSECAPGDYVSNPGTSTNDRECTACANETFSVVANALSCAPWTACAPGQFVASPGSSTTDRECSACAAGTFSDTSNAAACSVCGAGAFNLAVGSSSCAAWSTCLAGEYVTFAGTTTSDRACGPCGNGTFSTTSNTSACTPHARCNFSQTEANPGTQLSDRTCRPTPSCVGLVGLCGEDLDENCCSSATVHGGEFELMNEEGSTAAVSAFRLDKFEVTVGRFRKFVAAWDGGYRPESGAGKHTHLNGREGLTNANSSSTYETGWDSDWEDMVSTLDSARGDVDDASTWTSSVSTNERMPINNVNWYEAYAFCAWDGGFLPSSAELNYASTAGAAQRFYPWSAPATSTVIGATYASYGCVGDANSLTCSLNDIKDVGRYPSGAGLFGQLDLGGNVEEWVLDEYPASFACADCAYLPATFNLRTLRGGAYNSPATSLETRRLNMYDPSIRRSEGGFRCARVY